MVFCFLLFKQGGLQCIRVTIFKRAEDMGLVNPHGLCFKNQKVNVLFQFGCVKVVIFPISEVTQGCHKLGRNVSHRMNPLKGTWELWRL